MKYMLSVLSYYTHLILTDPGEALLQFLSYLFWPNPGNATYQSPKGLALLVFCAALVIASFALRFWRTKLTNSMTRKLSRSWPSAAFWFGLTGLVFVVSRVEGISYLSMRFLWVLWFVGLVVYLYAQWRLFRARHYEVLPREESHDPREKYLPKKRK